MNTAAGAAAITVSSALVNATTKTVTLTLSRAVASTETVTVSYTKPESGAVVQDAAGNDAANFSSRAVTNNTPAPPELDVAITLADYALTTGETTIVTFTFNQPVNGFEASDIIMCGSGTLSAPVANAARMVWTATFTPTVNVSALTNVIVVNLAGVTDDAGNAGNAGNAGSEGDVASPNYSVDTTRPAADTVAPVFSSATVTGNQLVLTYTEAGTLDAAALTGNAGFTVNTAAGATAITVSSALVSATAKT
ncbi:SwmB domain-containing protein, partial [Verminephrobacter aporrectodeae]|uniref:SwmB domain-containing protein n=1 Tax=Verminephrobacter aporrectodeae TaxID=1110389 RepID=UPI000593E718